MKINFKLCRFDIRYAEVSRITVIFACICDLYMRNYSPKMIKYVDEDGKRRLLQQMVENINHANGFDSDDVELREDINLTRLPKRDNSEGWTSVKISELDTVLGQFPVSIPSLQVNVVK